MKKLYSLVMLSVLLCGAVQAQQPREEPPRYEFSLFGGYPQWGDALLGSINMEDPKDTDSKLKGVYTTGARLTINTRGYYGHEFEYVQQRARFQTEYRTTIDDVPVTKMLEDRVTVRQASYNFLMYCMHNGEFWRPYITAGLQMYNFGAPRFEEWPGGGSRNYGVNWGGGLKLKFGRALLRFDFRDYIGGKPYHLKFEERLENFSTKDNSGGSIHNRQLTVGLGITF